MNINLDNLVKALSLALDFAEMSAPTKDAIIEDISRVNYTEHTFMNHSKKVTYLSLEIAKSLSLDERILENLYISALLHDIGAVEILNFSHSCNDFIVSHCDNGYDILKSFSKFGYISYITLHHHENWDGSGPNNLKGKEIPIESQIIRLADLIAVQYVEENGIHTQKDFLRNWVISNANKIFSKELVDAFIKASKNDIFWFNLKNVSYIPIILDKIAPLINVNLNIDELEDIAYMFSKIIDKKSAFTAKHSNGIANLAFNVAKYIGYDEEKCKKMRIAGLLHDIGKLAIPSNILDKNGSLTPEEFSTIKEHAYYTRIILDSIGGIDDIAQWASNHHEKLDGTGYPCGLTANELSLECRILCVCDIYQALTEDRPYRKGLEISEAIAIINDMVNDNKLCGKAASLVFETVNS